MSIKKTTFPKSIQIPLLQKVQELKLRNNAFGKREIFDGIRKKWVALQPEEMVRQALIKYLTELPGFSLSRMAVERGVKGSTTKKRFDILVYDFALKPFILVECKAPEVSLSEESFEQVSWYNYNIQAPYYILTNGATTYCCGVDQQQKMVSFLSEIPTLVSK